MAFCILSLDTPCCSAQVSTAVSPYLAAVPLIIPQVIAIDGLLADAGTAIPIRRITRRKRIIFLSPYSFRQSLPYDRSRCPPPERLWRLRLPTHPSLSLWLSRSRLYSCWP